MLENPALNLLGARRSEACSFVRVELASDR